MHEQFSIDPCPFCGNAALITGDTDTGYNVRDYADVVICGGCGTRGPWAYTEKEAVKLWNRRSGLQLKALSSSLIGPGRPINRTIT